jgi:hypothetical protein
MWDLDFILGLGEEEGEGLSRRPELFEIGRTLSKGKAKRRIFIWSTRRIGAAVGEGKVAINRHLGLVGKGPVTLTLPELSALDKACEDWKIRRHGWAAYWASCAGYPGGYGGAWYYQAPGKRSKQVQVGSSTVGSGKKGRDFVGKDERRTLARPLHVSHRVTIEEEIWRVGECCGDPKGEKTGLVYRLGGGARLEAERHGAILRKGARHTGIEPNDEEAFVRELLAAVRPRRR